MQIKNNSMHWLRGVPSFPFYVPQEIEHVKALHKHLICIYYVPNIVVDA